MRTADSERDEWLLDESLKETFPASDSTSSALPGSLLGMRYATASRAPEAVDSPKPTLQPWLISALIGGFIVGVVLARGRDY